MFALAVATALCAAQAPATLTLDISPGMDVDYSDAVLAHVELRDGANQGIAGKRVDFFLTSVEHSISCSPGSLPATGADGSAGPLRVRFVDGACGGSAFVAEDPEGATYVLEARFAGDAEYELAAAEQTLRLHRETVTLQLPPEHSGQLLDTIQLFATLVDENGDVEPDGTGTTGRQQRPIGSAELFFYVDLNDDGDFADVDEALGASSTGANGAAGMSFDATPIAGLPRAGLHRDAVRAEFAGDRRYKIAAGLSDLRLEPAPVDPARTLLEVTPASAPADGVSRISLQATLRDQTGNPYGPDDNVHAVRFESSLGELLEQATRDPGTGRYLQELRTARAAGVATVTVFVDDVEGASATVEFTAAGCGCGGAGYRSGAGWVAIAALFWRRRHRRCG